MEIHWRNPNELTEAEREHAEERIQKLAQGSKDLIDLWIDVEPSSNHHRKGNEQVTLRCQARGRELVAHGHGEEIGLALKRALQTFERDVRRMRDKRKDRRMEPPPSAPPVLGVVDRVFPVDGYGFVWTDAGEQVYFHRNAVGDGLAFDGLEEGQRVALNVEPGEKGPQATILAPAPPDASTP